MCLLTFWLLLRQALTEKENSQKDTRDAQLSTIAVHMKGKTHVSLTDPQLSGGHLSVVLCASEDHRVYEDLQKKEEVSYEEVLLLQRGAGGVKMEALAAVVRRMFVKYWIYICGTMFFFVSFEGKIVLYKVIYMVMFLCCVALYQVISQHYKYFRCMDCYFMYCLCLQGLSCLGAKQPLKLSRLELKFYTLNPMTQACLLVVSVGGALVC